MDSLYRQDMVRIVRTNNSLDTVGTVRIAYIMIGQDRLGLLEYRIRTHSGHKSLDSQDIIHSAWSRRVRIE